MRYKVSRIIWDTDGEAVDLPTTVVLELEDKWDADAALSDQYGFCVLSYMVEEELATN